MLLAAFSTSALLAPTVGAQSIRATDARVTPGARATRALSARELENLVAFTSALGYVRFFHPSVQSVHTNWDDLAVRGIRAVDGAPTADSLAAALRAIFALVAPTVTFDRTGVPPRAVADPPLGASRVVFWEHAGVGSPSGSPAESSARGVYSSVRVIAPVNEIGTPITIPGVHFMPGGSVPRVPDPSHPLHVALGGGVSMTLPIGLYTRDSVVPDSMMTAHPANAVERFSAEDRAARLADVALAWSLLQNFYPYFDVVHTDWPAALRSALSTAATDADANAFQSTLARLIAALHDGHGTVLRRDAPAVAMPDTRLGWAEGQVVVTEPGTDGTTHDVHRGDVVMAIDSRPVNAVIADRREITPGATPQWVRARVLRALLGGEPGTTVTVTLRDAAGKLRDVRLRRSAASQVDAQRPPKIAEVAPGVLYVDLSRINDIDFATALPRLARAHGVIFDGRGYPRQVNTMRILALLADSTIHSAHFEVPVQTLPDRREVGYVDAAWTIPPSRPTLKGHIAYLIGGAAISYAESTAGVVETYHLADLVGEPTAGTNGNVNPFFLPGGYQVIWTGMRVVKRDGTPHHGVGIAPTIPVSPTIAGIRAGRDEVLERAIAVVSRKP